ncbi:5-oxoprolinase subunit B family protein [Agromyces silvae]|uniref:5-oxoprolinase subunit B family protein n=1 Tax=Agromyces silvae TaxID=3388266 RepID=UPI00280A76A6|nr:allophanate hydrolase subunit 1 [Agromyces protaetiae]
MSVRILPSGEAALLVDCGGLGQVLALHDALAAAPIDGLVELVPAARTLLVAVDPARLPLETAAAWVRRTAAADEGSAVEHAAGPAAREAVVVPVVYDGADLSAVADLLGLTVDEVVARHVDATWRVAFIGFAPGFAYLVSDDWAFDVPRLASPRTRVPAGAVGLAGTFSGAYPRESPGGWQLIGRTEASLWDLAADPPALLTPGATVRFERSTR